MTIGSFFADGVTADSVLTAPRNQGAGGIEVQEVYTTLGTEATSSVINMIPFNKGAKVYCPASALLAGNVGAGTTTLDVGFVYVDTTLTDDPDAFVDGSTVAQSGGLARFEEPEGFTFVAEGDGFLAVTVLTAGLDAVGSVTMNAIIY